MYTGQMIFSQIIDFLPQHELRKCVQRYRGNYKVQKFSCNDQFLCMAFAQLTYRESLRDIETCLRAMQTKLYHTGIRSKVARSTLADANEKRDWRIYCDFAHVLIKTARKLYAGDDFGVQLDQAAYVLDSTMISLCLSLFPWARYRIRKGAIKLHTLLDLRGNIPSFIRVTDGKVHDASVLDDIVPEAGAFYIMDRAYINFNRLHTLTKNMAYFVIRTKRNIKYSRHHYHQVDKSTGLRSDQTIVLTNPITSQHYPMHLRRISFVDTENRKRFVFFTNNFNLQALIIPQLYKCRWQVELFFKWIKQHLRIKSFFGTSENAVKTQIWIAISIYV